MYTRVKREADLWVSAMFKEMRSAQEEGMWVPKDGDQIYKIVSVKFYDGKSVRFEVRECRADGSFGQITPFYLAIHQMIECGDTLILANDISNCPV